MKHFVKIICAVCLSVTQTITGQQTGEIHKAVFAGDMNKIREIIDADTTLLESKDEDGKTPLNIACFMIRNGFAREPEIAKFLISRGANVNSSSNDGFTPLYGACTGSGPDFDLVKQLIAKGANVNAKNNDGSTALFETATSRNLEVTRFLIEHGADVNAFATWMNSNVLDLVISISTEEMAKLIIESGAKLNQKDPLGNTELHLAAMRGFTNVIRILVEHGADVNALNNENHTALYYAAKHGYRLAADALIASGADKSTIIESNFGKPPQLTEKLKRGEAYLWYFAEGYAVKTKNNFLLFDFYLRNIGTSPEAGLANGHPNAEEFVGHKNTVFMSLPTSKRGWSNLYGLAKQLPATEWVFLDETNNGISDSVILPSWHLISADKSLNIGDIKVHTLAPMNEGEIGYLVEVDGVKIFYGGGHVSSNNALEVARYRKEIDILKPFGSIDIAILRVSGHFSNAYEPYLYLLDHLTPKTVYLLGGVRSPDEYQKCEEVLRSSNIPIKYPDTRIAGDRFHYLRDSEDK